jgi:hypothetical protein
MIAFTQAGREALGLVFGLPIARRATFPTYHMPPTAFTFFLPVAQIVHERLDIGPATIATLESAASGRGLGNARPSPRSETEVTGNRG